MNTLKFVCQIMAIIILISIDNQASGVLPNYGGAMRIVVGLTIIGNVVMMYDLLRGIALAPEASDPFEPEHGDPFKRG